jgi:hypothetical protein
MSADPTLESANVLAILAGIAVPFVAHIKCVHDLCLERASQVNRPVPLDRRHHKSVHRPRRILSSDPNRLYDVAIVDAGPAGLATAVQWEKGPYALGGDRYRCSLRAARCTQPRRLRSHQRPPLGLALEGKLIAGQGVVLVGAGNSAGQAVAYLATQASKVWVIVRGKSLESSMSRYLVDASVALPSSR